MSTSECAAAIAGFASAEPSRLRALPASCTIEDVSLVLHSLDTSTRGMLAKRDDAMTIRWFSSDKLPEIHAWVDASGHVVLLDAQWPPATAEQYLKALGQPDHKLDYQWRGSPLAGGEPAPARRPRPVL